MKITKYPQSCMVIEVNSVRIAIDPGSFVTGFASVSDLLPLDAILITHEHQDHADPTLIKELTAKQTIPVIGNESTAKTLLGIITKVVKDGESFQIADVSITARELPHVAMIDGSAGPQNTGYVMNDIFFHPGDGISIENLEVKVSAVPIAGPDISPRDVFSFIKQVGCRVAIPIHYDYFKEDPAMLSQLFSSQLPEVKMIVLANGQSTEV